MTVPRVHMLPKELAGKIAAGEVVERPASVVKELVENALDAGANRIFIELERGGRELIRVVDDGCGIVAEDLPLVFARHATSKISREDDLNGIRSLGFRGEALAAIGSVAWVRIQSQIAGASVGGQLVCEGGQLGTVEPWSGPVGTCVEVRRLFFNTPVRRKFLRSVAAELGQIVELVQRLALAFAGVQVRLHHNGREVLEVLASWDTCDRIRYFFGEDVAERLLRVEYETSLVRVHGWVGHPEYDRPNARWQYFFVNRRWIRDRVLGHALQEGYRGYLMVGRQPLAFLFLELPPESVDVNVHPTKSEVRFRDQQAVYQAVLFGVRQALKGTNLTPQLSAQTLVAAPRLTRSPRAHVTATSHQSREQVAPGVTGAGLYRIPERTSVEPQLAAPGRIPSVAEPKAHLPSEVGTGASEIHQPGGAAPRVTSSKPPAPAAPETPGESSWFTSSTPWRAMQLHNTYLVVETPDGLLLVDQHALHERILYEQFRQQIQGETLPCQALLVPEPVDLTPHQAALVLEHRQALVRLGLSVSEFGGSTVLVNAVPACWKRAPAELVLLSAEYLAELHSVPEPQVLLDDLLKRMACRAAIKAGDPLSDQEMAFLLEHRQLVENTDHCPHGRPTALFLSKHELERQFRRLA